MSATVNISRATLLTEGRTYLNDLAIVAGSLLPIVEAEKDGEGEWVEKPGGRVITEAGDDPDYSWDDQYKKLSPLRDLGRSRWLVRYQRTVPSEDDEAHGRKWRRLITLHQERRSLITIRDGYGQVPPLPIGSRLAETNTEIFELTQAIDAQQGRR